jgi:hypothetical protein
MKEYASLTAIWENVNVELLAAAAVLLENYAIYPLSGHGRSRRFGEEKNFFSSKESNHHFSVSRSP